MAVNFNLAPGEYLVPCPYNVSHQITNQRMMGHLDKCRRNYRKEMSAKGKDCEIVSCRFNWAHQYPKIEIDYHHKHCPDQHQIIEHIKYHSSAEFQELKQSHQQATTSSNNAAQNDDDEEDWDAETTDSYTPGYDPNVKLETSNILYMPRGLSKSERKNFQKQQREKLRESQEVEAEEFPSHMAPAGTLRKQ